MRGPAALKRLPLPPGVPGPHLPGSQHTAPGLPAKEDLTAIRTQQSLTGFIASGPQLTFTAKGDARFYAKFGQEHYRRNDDGSFTKLDTIFHDLMQYRRAAERAYAAFVKGDRFVAEGYVRTYEHQVDGQTRQGEEFIAKKLGYDTARTAYSVDRTRRPATVDQTQAAGAPTRDHTPGRPPDRLNPAVTL